MKKIENNLVTRLEISSKTFSREAAKGAKERLMVEGFFYPKFIFATSRLCVIKRF